MAMYGQVTGWRNGCFHETWKLRFDEETMREQAASDDQLARRIRQARETLKAFEASDSDLPRELVASDSSRGVEAPPLEHPIPAGAVTIGLPPIDQLELGTMPLVNVLSKRRSRRLFSDVWLSLEELSYLCWAVAGVHTVAPRNLWSMRTSPSRGGRHPFETYLVIERVTGVTPGIYRYSALHHQLVLVREEPGICVRLSEKAVQGFVQQCAVLFVWTVVPYRAEWKYSFAGAKEMAIDIGHYCQNLYLAAESIGAGTCALAAYDQETLDKTLGVDGDDEFTIYVSPVGKIEI